MALTAPRNTEKLGTQPVPEVLSAPMKGSTKIFAGSLTCLDSSGRAVVGSESTTLRAAGRARTTVDNTAGADGAKRIEIERGVFKFNNSAAGDQITDANVLTRCYIVDDSTVAKTDNSGARSLAGLVLGVDSDGVWVQVGG